jgi:hypothetical protein
VCAEPGVLAQIFEPGSTRFRHAHRIYHAAQPREFSNGAVVETRISFADVRKVEITDEGRLVLPEGALITKQISYRVRSDDSNGSGLVETCGGRPVVRSDSLEPICGSECVTCPVELRVLRKSNAKWSSHVYTWLEGAWHPAPGGQVVSLRLDDGTARGSRTFEYVVPGLGECRTCHQGTRDAARFGPIGLTVSRLDEDSLETLSGVDSGVYRARKPPHIPSHDGKPAGLARAYLHANCGFCHNPNGLAASSGLLLDDAETDPLRLGICKRPVAFGVPSSFGAYDILPGHPERSVLIQRMASLEAGVAMPELGRSILDGRGISIVSAWIGQLAPGCDQVGP